VGLVYYAFAHTETAFDWKQYRIGKRESVAFPLSTKTLLWNVIVHESDDGGGALPLAVRLAVGRFVKTIRCPIPTGE